MRRGTSLRTLLLTALLTAVAVSSIVHAGPVTERYPNGKTKRRFTVNGRGQIHGRYREFHENGKEALDCRFRKGVRQGPVTAWDDSERIIRKGDYEADRFSGTVYEYEGDAVSRETLVLEDLVLEPNSEDLIRRQIREILGGVDDLPGESEEDALRLLQVYRYLCGVPWQEMRLNPEFREKTDAAVAFFAEFDDYGHDIKNRGWPEDRFRLASDGAKRSNLNQVPVSAGENQHVWARHLDAWIFEGFQRQRRVGHRLECLKPLFREVAFSRMGRYAAMWVRDDSGRLTSQIPFIAYPPPGVVPLRWVRHPGAAWSVNPELPWSISLHGLKFRTKSGSLPAVSVHPVRHPPGGVADLTATPSLKLSDVNLQVCHPSANHKHAIVFYPEGMQYRGGSAYLVEVDGLVDPGGSEAPLRYYVRFVD